ncbi:DUF1810 domain-containing protein [Phenylobacterium sp.]|uniref:DUF1810 domain-containing protein n=1 Tax=Phenylobacterium sp. TaxID=1871053 RepID=UPI002E302694|nr:DUF1810 domain-containing protein [Phenylobacterium sp.]HEX2558835.1 DUF1810 domain-containing protein [Phenylobacterium sp.]
MSADPFRLSRFVDAQASAYEAALAELKRGRKTSHWIWFVFPQIAGLGFSQTSQFYAIGSLDEARAYLDHPILGPRLGACVATVLNHRGRSAREIFGTPDDMKFCSSMTLFAHAAPDEPLFRQALEAFFAGERDPLTLQRLAGEYPRDG